MLLYACFSSKFADALYEAGIPVVISINCKFQISEVAVQKFNSEFIRFVLLGMTPKNAF